MRKLLCGLGFAALLFTASPADATVVKAMTLIEKTEASPVVIHATVQRVTTQWEVFGAMAQTLITVRIIESIKGEARKGELLTITRGGGTIGDFHQTAPGLAEYEPGEEVILFLEPLGAYLVALGIGIGTYRVEQSGRNKLVTHNPKVAGVRLNGDKPARIKPIEPMEPEPLDKFLKRIRSYAKNLSTQPAVRPQKGAQIILPEKVQPKTMRER